MLSFIKKKVAHRHFDIEIEDREGDKAYFTVLNTVQKGETQVYVRTAASSTSTHTRLNEEHLRALLEVIREVAAE